MIERSYKMNNSEQFLKTFNEIERLLKDIVNLNDYLSFVDLAKKASISNPVVRQWLNDLKQHASLRNAIVHTSDNRFLAEPYDETVHNLKLILEQIKNPPKVNKFFYPNILKCNTTDKVHEILIKMKQNNFSQIPVYREDEFVALLTTDTIARWVGEELKKHELVLDDNLVENVLEHAETNQNYDIVSRDKLLVEVIDIFEKNYSSGKNLSAILITHNGKKNQKLLGIITPFDIPQMNRLMRTGEK